LWDVVKDQICNRVFETLDAIEEKITEALRLFWPMPEVWWVMAGYTFKKTIRPRA